MSIKERLAQIRLREKEEVDRNTKAELLLKKENFDKAIQKCVELHNKSIELSKPYIEFIEQSQILNIIEELGEEKGQKPFMLFIFNAKYRENFNSKNVPYPNLDFSKKGFLWIKNVIEKQKESFIKGGLLSQEFWTPTPENLNFPSADNLKVEKCEIKLHIGSHCEGTDDFETQSSSSDIPHFLVASFIQKPKLFGNGEDLLMEIGTEVKNIKTVEASFTKKGINIERIENSVLGIYLKEQRLEHLQ